MLMDVNKTLSVSRVAAQFAFYENTYTQFLLRHRAQFGLPQTWTPLAGRPLGLTKIHRKKKLFDLRVFLRLKPIAMRYYYVNSIRLIVPTLSKINYSFWLKPYSFCRENYSFPDKTIIVLTEMLYFT